MYDTAYQRNAKLTPNNSTENISGLISGKGDHFYPKFTI